MPPELDKLFPMATTLISSVTFFTTTGIVVETLLSSLLTIISVEPLDIPVIKP